MQSQLTNYYVRRTSIYVLAYDLLLNVITVLLYDCDDSVGFHHGVVYVRTYILTYALTCAHSKQMLYDIVTEKTPTE